MSIAFKKYLSKFSLRPVTYVVTKSNTDVLAVDIEKQEKRRKETTKTKNVEDKRSRR